MSSSPGTKTLFIGIGNFYRRDDGVGIVVARRLRELWPTGVRIVEASGEGGALMAAWEGAESVVLVDAVQSGAPPGTIHRLDANRQPIPGGFFHYSTHAFSVAEAIELARALDRLPPHLLVYGIEGQCFAAGLGLSPAVTSAAATLVRQLQFSPFDLPT